MTAPGDEVRAEAGRLAVMQAMGWADDRGYTEYAGAMWELAGEVATAVALAGAPVPAGPSQGQDIPTDQIDALVEHAESTAAEWKEFRGTLARLAYQVGYAAALGYEITIGDLGDRVHIGDQVEQPGPAITGPDWVTTPAEQHALEQAVITAATAYREACRELDWRAEIQPRFDALVQIRATVDALQAATK